MLTKNKPFEGDSVCACTRQPSSGRPQIRSDVAPCGQRTANLLPRSKVLRGKCDDGLNWVSQISIRAPIVTVPHSHTPSISLPGPHSPSRLHTAQKSVPYTANVPSPSPRPTFALLSISRDRAPRSPTFLSISRPPVCRVPHWTEPSGDGCGQASGSSCSPSGHPQRK